MSNDRPHLHGCVWIHAHCSNSPVGAGVGLVAVVVREVQLVVVTVVSG